MASNEESFWELGSYAVVGHAARRNFPILTYRALKRRGQQVYPVDPSRSEIDGDRVHADLTTLPDGVDGVILEVPRDETAEWVARTAAAGIRELWIHMGRDTPEALALAYRERLHVRSGHCAVMYLTSGFNVHTAHRWIARTLGHY